MKPNPSSLVLLLLVAATALGGCFSQGSPPSLASFPLVVLGDGDQFTYSFDGRGVPDLVPVSFVVDVSAGDGALGFRYTYTHPTRPEFDSQIDYVLADDGSWEHGEFACEPVFFHEKNRKCYTHRGGYSDREGTHGAFFGASLLAGLPILDGRIHRPIQLGTALVDATFLVEETARSVIVRPGDDATRAISGQPYYSGIEPSPCFIFNSVLEVDKATGIPVDCHREPDDPGEGPGFGWTLESRRPGSGPSRSFAASLTNLSDSGRGVFPGLPQRGDETRMPFGFWEAMDAARLDPRTSEFAGRNDIWLGDSTLIPSSGGSTGPCPTCLATMAWEWSITLLAEDASLNMTVRKDYADCTEIAATVTEAIMGSGAEVPTRVPRLQPMDVFWDAAWASTNVSDFLLAYLPPWQDSPLWTHQEPLVVAVFMSPPDAQSALNPQIWFRSDATVEWWLARGATTAGTSSCNLLPSQAALMPVA